MTVDGAIPDATLSRDAAPFDALMTRHQQRVFALAARLTGNVEDAQEITQDAFLRLYDHRAKLRDENAVQAWLRTVTLNLCRDRARRKTRVHTMNMPEVASPDASPERRASESQREQLLRSALQQLSDRERTALVLRELEGLSTEEVAAHMQVAEVTVRVQIMQARLKLRQLLQPTVRDNV